MAEKFADPGAYERAMGRWSALVAPPFAEFAQVRDGGRVLDVGCGTGSLVQALLSATRRCEVVGIDLTAPFVDYSRARFVDPRVTFDCGSALALPYPNGSFDHALSLLVLMHLPDPAKA